MMLRAAITHALLLAVPVVLVGHGDGVARAQGLAIVLAMIVFAIVEGGAKRGADAIRFGAPGTRLALATGLALLVTTWMALASDAHPDWAWLGAPLVAFGVALRFVAIRALGDAFSSETAIVPGRRILRSGPYAVVRHPSEIGLVAIAGGISTLGASAPGAAMVIGVIVPASIVRIRAENAVLAAAASRC